MLAWEIQYRPWLDQPYGVYLVGGVSVLGDLVARFDYEELARHYCEQRLMGRCVATYPIEQIKT